MTKAELEELAHYNVPRETFEKLALLQSLVVLEAEKQNLISRATLDEVWTRHIVDSVQLIKFYTRGSWLDLGTGAGFPGMVVAAFDFTDVVLVEERRLRHEFLSRTVEALELKNVRVIGSKIQQVETFAAGVISARAFASLDKIFRLSTRFSHKSTRWVLPKGKNAATELASLSTMWHGDFRLEPSVTDPDSQIIVAENVSLKVVL